MPLIEWKDEYSVQVKEIDDQHKQLVGFINILHEAMTLGKGREALEPMLASLVDYADRHFSTEEKYFDQCYYPEARQHKDEHKKFTDKVQSFQSDYAAGRVCLSIHVLEFLRKWLEDHLIESDQKYVSCFVAHGLK